MALSKKWKIIWGVVAGIALAVVLTVIALVYFGGQFVNQMRGVAQDVYGGPLPSHVSNILALDLQTSKIAVLMDQNSQIALVLMETPQKNDGSRPFSEPDVKKALAGLGRNEKEVQNALQGSSEGTPDTLELEGQTIHTLNYMDGKGQNSVVGVLNLEDSQLVFIATAAIPPSKEAIVAFLKEMPAIQNTGNPSP